MQSGCRQGPQALEYEGVKRNKPRRLHHQIDGKEVQADVRYRGCGSTRLRLQLG